MNEFLNYLNLYCLRKANNFFLFFAWTFFFLFIFGNYYYYKFKSNNIWFIIKIRE